MRSMGQAGVDTGPRLGSAVAFPSATPVGILAFPWALPMGTTPGDREVTAGGAVAR